MSSSAKDFEDFAKDCIRLADQADTPTLRAGFGAYLEAGGHRRSSARESPSPLGRCWRHVVAFYALSVDERSLPHDYSSTDGRSHHRPTVTYRAVLPLDGMANVLFRLRSNGAPAQLGQICP